MPSTPHRRLALLGALLVVFLAAPAPAHAAEAPNPVPTEQLQQRKLEEEVRKLRIENDRNDGPFGWLIPLAPFLTALVAIGTLGAAFYKQTNDNRRQRQADADQRDSALQQRFDEQFSAAVNNVGATEPGKQAAGAASLLRFATWRDGAYQREILAYLAAQLRIGVEAKVRPLLVDLLGQVLREGAAEQEKPAKGTPARDLNLAGADLHGIDIEDVPFQGVQLCLTGTDLAAARLRNVQLRRADAERVVLADAGCEAANFGEARLDRARCDGAFFGGARFGSAHMRDASCVDANFRGARLQSAHFERTDFAQADFTAADVNDTYFHGAHFDPAALATLARAKNVDKAHFDDDVRAAVDLLRAAEGRPRRPWHRRRRRWLSASRTPARSRASAAPCRSTAASRCPRPAG